MKLDDINIGIIFALQLSLGTWDYWGKVVSLSLFLFGLNLYLLLSYSLLVSSLCASTTARTKDFSTHQKTMCGVSPDNGLMEFMDEDSDNPNWNKEIQSSTQQVKHTLRNQVCVFFVGNSFLWNPNFRTNGTFICHAHYSKKIFWGWKFKQEIKGNSVKIKYFSVKIVTFFGLWFRFWFSVLQ